VKILNVNRVFSTPFLNIDLAEIKTTTGNIIEHFIIDPIHNSVVAVVLKGDKVILVQTKKFLWDKKSWELPGGRIKEGEIALSAIRRKVEEETGFEVTNIRRLGSTFSNLSLSKKEKFYFFVEVGNKKFEHNENIIEKVSLFSLEQIKNLINRGMILDEKSLTGLILAEKRGFL
jgi:8-oxo-dGTP pyrophosphatase MutT (NUDIX family)